MYGASIYDVCSGEAGPDKMDKVRGGLNFKQWIRSDRGCGGKRIADIAFAS